MRAPNEARPPHKQAIEVVRGGNLNAGLRKAGKATNETQVPEGTANLEPIDSRSDVGGTEKHG